MRNWLVPAADYISTWIAFQQRHHGLPGVSIAIADDDKLVLDASYGVANRRTGARLTPKHRFRVASHSKTFTATCRRRSRSNTSNS